MNTELNASSHYFVTRNCLQLCIRRMLFRWFLSETDLVLDKNAANFIILKVSWFAHFWLCQMQFLYTIESITSSNWTIYCPTFTCIILITQWPHIIDHKCWFATAKLIETIKCETFIFSFEGITVLNVPELLLTSTELNYTSSSPFSVNFIFLSVWQNMLSPESLFCTLYLRRWAE